MPPVRGRTRHQTIATFVGAATLSGGAVGAALGLTLGALPTATVEVVAIVTTVALLVDRLGWPAVPASPHQVPRVWSQVFSAPTVGLLFGTRLGIGPSTQLNTWTWWVAAVLAASHGGVASAAVGAAFGLCRTIAMVLVARRSETDGTAASFFGALRAAETRFARRAGATVGLVAIAIAFTACTNGGETVTVDPTTTADGAAEVGGTVQTRPSTTIASEPSTVTTPPLDPDSSTSTTDGDATAASSTTVSTSSPTTGAGEPEAAATLGDLLLAATDDRRIIADPRADVALDLEAAALRQPDPEAERPLLQTRGFQEGWSRAFDAGDDVIVIATAYRFEDDVEAAFYLEDGLITVGGAGAQLFEVEETPGLRGFSIATGDEATTTSHGATFTRDDLWFLIVVDGPTGQVSAQDAVTLARAQLGRVDELVGAG